MNTQYIHDIHTNIYTIINPEPTRLQFLSKMKANVGLTEMVGKVKLNEKMKELENIYLPL